MMSGSGLRMKRFWMVVVFVTVVETTVLDLMFWSHQITQSSIRIQKTMNVHWKVKGQGSKESLC